jgi:hypothetical protein
MQERRDLRLACEASEPVQSEVSIAALQIAYLHEREKDAPREIAGPRLSGAYAPVREGTTEVPVGIQRAHEASLHSTLTKKGLPPDKHATKTPECHPMEDRMSGANMMQIGIDSFAAAISDPATGLTLSPVERMQHLLEEIELADQVGLDVFGIGEHHRAENRLDPRL